jgi:Methyltransferase domain
MEAPRSHKPYSQSGPACPGDGTSWAESASLPRQPVESGLIRPDAPKCEPLPAQEARGLMNKLSVLLAQLKCGEIVVPKSVSHVAIEGLVSQWRQGDAIPVGRTSEGDFIVRSTGQNEEFEAFFAMLSPDRRPLIAGLLTDRDLKDHWPKVWQDYSDVKGKKLLDHCCGLGLKVRLLREQGVDAHGVDISTFGNTTEAMHYGRAESLPFCDQSFDRVESRMGVLLWGQDNREMCRATLAEIARVTKDGGTIRILPVRESLLRDLVAERSDLSFDESPPGCFGAFQLRVQRPRE